ncbi:hydrogenase expression/formation protein HypE [Gimesia panareensis]|uniref:Hydrogenase isoenzymes formation protein HypE n=1 Tax=Gimesia panareensis TaxID=2527978 RepID=A0A518A9K4_9PLAN|nr:hydrogenase expression/formation protein HypE [Gimesia panareensis]QDT28544.1 Hydrogenase isoenzymes formation protein HypE [Gimesia panareensis]QDU51401.1 Hydrogenase isoenzymes formation protein HypE [Gimesia panareensis]
MSERERNLSGSWQLNCPVLLLTTSDCVTLAHGEGGRLSRKLIQECILKTLQPVSSLCLNDAAPLPRSERPLAMTTDSYVITPLFFPGGDIGSLAVYGTVNDLAVSGARPLWLTLSLIIEEGLPLAVLERILESVAQTAAETGVQIMAGDTKVVPRGAADGLFINTAGVGELMDPVPVGPDRIQAGDELIVSGPVGQHGIAVMAVREELGVEPVPQSDSGSLFPAVENLRHKLGARVRCLRDATRGGVSAVLHEWAAASDMTLSIEERLIPVTPEVRGISELLGLDPLHIANEGTMLIAVEQGAGAEAVAELQGLPGMSGAQKIGEARERGIAAVTVRRTLGAEQPLADPLGSPLPRIC